MIPFLLIWLVLELHVGFCFPGDDSMPGVCSPRIHPSSSFIPYLFFPIACFSSCAEHQCVHFYHVMLPKRSLTRVSYSSPQLIKDISVQRITPSFFSTLHVCSTNYIVQNPVKKSVFISFDRNVLKSIQ